MTIAIDSLRIASAIFGGFAIEDYAQGFVDTIGNILNATGKALRAAGTFIKNIAKSWYSWFQDDAVGATAGVLLVVVVLVVGGAVVGAVAGGISALMGAGIIGKLTAWFGGLTLAALIGVTIRYAVRGYMFIHNFNWNLKDSEIAQQQQSLINALYGQAGEALGTVLGTGCGTAVVEISKRFKVVKFNPITMARIKEVSQWKFRNENGAFAPTENVPELYEEMVESIGDLLRLTQNQLTRYAFLESYKNIRKLIKAGAEIAELQNFFPGLAERIQQWGAEDSTPWSFAIAAEEKIDNIKDPRWQDFAEEFYESFMDQCLESLMIVSYAYG